MTMKFRVKNVHSGEKTFVFTHLQTLAEFLFRREVVKLADYELKLAQERVAATDYGAKEKAVRRRCCLSW